MFKSVFILLICIYFVSAENFNCLFCRYDSRVFADQQNRVAYAQSIAIQMAVNMKPDQCSPNAVKTDGHPDSHGAGQMWLRFACSSTTPRSECMSWNDYSGTDTLLGGQKIQCDHWPLQ